MTALTTDVLAEINGLSPATDCRCAGLSFLTIWGRGFPREFAGLGRFPVRPRTVSPRLPQAVTTLAHTSR
jgi:hypothetical protein